MRIAFIGDFGKMADEGMRKISRQIFEDATYASEKLAVSSRDFCTLMALPRLRRFRPDVLHYITGPTVYSLLALAMNRRLLGRRVVTVATGTRPYLNAAGRMFLPWFAPDWYLAQARLWQRLFQDAGSRTLDFPNGVDCTRFKPTSPEEVRKLRQELGLVTARKLVLHVGHIRENRNLRALIQAQRSGRYQVLIVGSPTQSERGPLLADLTAAGCWIHTSYIGNIEHYYQAADIYVFTVQAKPPGVFPANYLEVGVIDFPLSILEAMACDLPLLTTRLDAVEYFLGGTEGLGWFDGTGEGCLEKLDGLTAEPASLRQTALRYDRIRTGETLRTFYQSLRSGGPDHEIDLHPRH